jgi:hypothetical protein
MISMVSGIENVGASPLLALLRHRHAPAVDVPAQFQALHRLVESLPLTSAEFCFAHNWLISA